MEQAVWITERIKLLVKWGLFPGLDLHTRCRYRFLPTFFRSGEIDTLDAGCGNAALSYAAYLLGSRVLGISNDPGQVEKASALSAFIGAPKERLAFKLLNLYDLPQLNLQFDQIICSETLEHVKDDFLILKYFHSLLRASGVLHLCCPYALHPEHELGRTNEPEDGRHVRDGYTMDSYKGLLDSAGFDIKLSAGLGSPIIVSLDRINRWFGSVFGVGGSAPFYFVTYPLHRLDYLNPPVPYSLYVQAIKRS